MKNIIINTKKRESPLLLKLSSLLSILAFSLLTSSFISTPSRLKVLKKNPLKPTKVLYNPTALTQNSASWNFTVDLTFYNGSCTGFFINLRKIITSSHCLKSAKEIHSLHFFKASKHAKRITDPALIANLKVRNHPSLDIAVITLPWVLEIFSLPTNYKPTLTSWNYFERSFRQFKADPIYVAASGYNNIYPNSYYLGFIKGEFTKYAPERAQFKFQNQGICHGDSGAPVMTISPIKGLITIGVVRSSTEDLGNKGCGSKGSFIPFTSELLDWIFNKV